MPLINGFQLLEIIKKDYRLRDIPVIMYSTGINETFANVAVSKGASGCIKKENTITDLADVLKKYVAGTNSAKAVSSL